MKFLVFILFSVLCFNGHSLDTKLTLELMNNEKRWDVGEIKDFKLMLHPITEVDDQDIKRSLLSREFVDIIKIIKIHKQSILRENPEYYIVEARGVLLKEPKTNFPKIWDYRGMAVAVDYSTIEFSNLPTSSREFFVFNSSVPDGLNKIIIIVLVLVSIVILMGLYYIYRKIRLKQELEKRWKDKVLLFESVSDRPSHEDIYQSRKSFYEIFEDRGAFEEYLNLLNKVQYKKKWDDSDLLTLNEAHRKAKEKIIVR